MSKVNLETGDLVIYGRSGVCRVTDIGERTFNRRSRRYYILKPIDDDRSTIYAPTDSEQAVGKMRRLLTKDEIIQLVSQVPQEPLPWIYNEHQRKEAFQQILAEGDRGKLIQMLRTLYLQKKKRTAAGRKLYSSDEQIFRAAEKLIFEEFCTVLHLKKNQLIPFLFGGKSLTSAEIQ